MCDGHYYYYCITAAQPCTLHTHHHHHHHHRNQIISSFHPLKKMRFSGFSLFLDFVFGFSLKGTKPPSPFLKISNAYTHTHTKREDALRVHLVHSTHLDSCSNLSRSHVVSDRELSGERIAKYEHIGRVLGGQSERVYIQRSTSESSWRELD